MIIFIALLRIASAATLFVDVNNAPKEIEACMNAEGDENVFVVTKRTDVNGRVIPVSAQSVEAQIAAMEAKGIPCTKIVWSGHQNAGYLTGENGRINANQINQILNRHPRTKERVTTMGFISCYAVNYHASQEFFVRPNEYVKQTVGFPIQSMTKDHPDAATAVGAYCRHGEEWAKKSSKSEICEIYEPLARLLKNQTVAICSREAIASHAYLEKTPDGDKICFTYEELAARCKDFDKRDTKLEMYEKFLAADDACQPGFANPPPDKGSQYEGGKSDLRKFYSDVHLWRQCAESFKKRRRENGRADQEAKYVMPEPRQMIRLIKFNELKRNLARLNATELADYDRHLGDLCLGQYALGDLTKLNRSEINRRISSASLALNQALDHPPAKSAGASSRAPGGDDVPRCGQPPPPLAQACPSKTGNTNPEVVERMNSLLRWTLVDLNNKLGEKAPRSCSPLELIEPNASEDFRSECIQTYAEAAAAL